MNIKLLSLASMLACTAQARALDESAEGDQRLQAISDLIDDEFGCHKTQTHKLVEMILQVELPKASVGEAPAFIVGSVIVEQDGMILLVTALDCDGDAKFITADGDTEFNRSDDDKVVYIDASGEFSVADDGTVRQFHSTLKDALSAEEVVA